MWKGLAAVMLAAGILCVRGAVGGPQPQKAYAADALKSGDWEYKLSDDSVTLTGYAGKDAEVTIPEKLGGYTVTEIGHSCMKNKKSLTTLTIPASVTKIEGYAFSGCSSLSKLYFNAANCKFGSYVFSGAALTSGNLSVEFGEGVMAVPECFFEFSGNENYPRVTSVKFADSVKTIGKSAFQNCKDLKNITWGSGLEKIGADAFRGCTDLTSLELPAKLSEIGHSAFREDKALTSIAVPAGVTDIEGYAFEGCSNLSELYYYAPNCKVGSYIFSGAGVTSGKVAVEFSAGVVNIPETLFEYSEDENYPRVYSVKFADSVKTIGNSAFKNCKELKEITWGTGLEKIGSYAFYGCTGLTSLELPEKLNEIGHSAFRENTALGSIMIPSSVTDIEGYAFSGCSNLTLLYYKAAKCSIGSYIFSGAGITSGNVCVKFAKGVTYVPKTFFEYSGDENYPRITAVEIADSVKTIGDDAFKNCKDLKEIQWGKGLEEIGSNVFQNCTGLTTVTLPEKLGKIGHSAFRGDIGLENVNIPASVTEIGGYAFEGCSNLTKVFCLAKNSNMGSYVFQNCTRVTIWCYKSSKIAADAATNHYQTRFLDPAAISVSKVTSGKKGFTLKWKKVSGIKGYEIRYSLKSGMGSAKVVKIKASGTSYKVTKLKAKKKYFIQIRAYSVVEGITVYGNWSAKQKVTTKK